MRLSLRACSLAFAALWGGLMLLVGILNFLFPPYGGEFLRVMSSVYPGYSAAPTFWGVLLGTLLGALDGAVAGFLVGWIYNRFLRWNRHPARPSA